MLIIDSDQYDHNLENIFINLYLFLQLSLCLLLLLLLLYYFSLYFYRDCFTCYRDIGRNSNCTWRIGSFSREERVRKFVIATT
jgi:hypothetical protein